MLVAGDIGGPKLTWRSSRAKLVLLRRSRRRGCIAGSGNR